MIRKTIGFGIGAFLVLSFAFLLTSTNLLFGHLSSSVFNVLVLYAILLLFAVAIFNKGKLPLLDAGEYDLFLMLIGFTATLLFTTLFSTQFLSSFDPIKALTAVGGFLYGGLKAYIETVVFQDALRRRLGNAIQAIIFGLFHLSVLITVYGFTGTQLILPIATLSLLGFTWGWMVEKFNTISFAWGSHWGWNIAVVGLRKAIIGI